MHTNSYDEALCLPSEEAVLVALRTQQVIQDEIRVTNTIDPMAGSYYVEWLTDELEDRIWKYMTKIEEAGGIVKALDSGWLYREMRDAFKKRQMRVELGEEKVIGINRYIMDEPIFENVFRTNPEAMQIEIDRIKNLKARRDNDKLHAILDELRKVCENETNVLPIIMDATREGATVGEICDIYREIWKIWEPPIVV